MNTERLLVGFFYDGREKLYKAKPHQKSVDRIKEKIKELTHEKGMQE